MSSKDRLLRRLREELKLEMPADASIRRTMAGRRNLQRENAQSWYVHPYLPSGCRIGSQFSIRQLLMALSLDALDDWGNIWVVPKGREEQNRVLRATKSGPRGGIR